MSDGADGPNAAQIEAWNGEAGEHWVALAEQYDRLNGVFARHIVERLAAGPGERVLDVGCGNGALALQVAAEVGPSGAVVGLDISGPMLGLARRRAADAGYGHVEFVQGDAQVHALAPGSFDAVVSRFGVMFFDDPVAAFANLAGALRPGGRVVFACWQDLLRNEWILVPSAAALEFVPMPDLGGGPGAPGPFSLADPERVRAVLGAAGLVDVGLDEVVEPMLMGTSVADAIAFMRQTDIAATLMAGVEPDVAEQAWAAMARALEPHVTERGVELNGATWLVTARRP